MMAAACVLLCTWLPAMIAASSWTRTLLDSASEVSNVELICTFGKLPTGFPPGTLVRNAPSTFHLGNRSVGNIFDGLPKLYSYTFAPDRGIVTASARYLNSTWRVQSTKAGQYIPTVLVNEPQPRWSLTEAAKAMTSSLDNPSVNVWPVQDATAFALSDTVGATAFDWQTGNTLGPVHYTDSTATFTPINMSIPVPEFSPAHPVRHPHTNATLNLRILPNPLSVADPFARHTIELYELQPSSLLNYNRRTIAKFKVAHLPYIHAFSVTTHYAVVIAYPVNVVLDRALAGPSFQQLLTYNRHRPATAYIINLETGLVSSQDLDVFFAFHHVNAFEEQQGNRTILTIDLPTYEAGQDEAIFSIWNLPLPSNDPPTINSTLHRVKLMLNEDQTVHSWSRTQLSNTPIELPRIADVDQGRVDYCHVYGWTPTSVISINVCSNTTNTFKGANGSVFYPSEPIPLTLASGAHVVLTTMTHDDQTDLVLLNATTLKPVATFVASQENREALRIPFSLHGHYFAA